MVRRAGQAIFQSAELVVWPGMEFFVYPDGHLVIPDLEITGIEEQEYSDRVFLFSIIA